MLKHILITLILSSLALSAFSQEKKEVTIRAVKYVGMNRSQIDTSLMVSSAQEISSFLSLFVIEVAPEAISIFDPNNSRQTIVRNGLDGGSTSWSVTLEREVTLDGIPEEGSSTSRTVTRSTGSAMPDIIREGDAVKVALYDMSEEGRKKLYSFDANFEGRDETQKVTNLSIEPTDKSRKFTLKFSCPEKGNVEIHIFTEEGKEMYSSVMYPFVGDYDQQITLAFKGTYYLAINYNDEILTKEFTVLP
jgi:hypothetical protein